MNVDARAITATVSDQAATQLTSAQIAYLAHIAHLPRPLVAALDRGDVPAYTARLLSARIDHFLNLECAAHEAQREQRGRVIRAA